MLLSSCSALASVAFGPQVAWRLGALVMLTNCVDKLLGGTSEDS